MKNFFRAAFALAVLSLPAMVSASETVVKAVAACCCPSCPGCC